MFPVLPHLGVRRTLAAIAVGLAFAAAPCRAQDLPSCAQTKVTIANGTDLDKFGNSVVMSGTYMLAGAPRTRLLHDTPGRVYVFDVNDRGPNWMPISELHATPDVADNAFGRSLSIDNGRLLVGAQHDTGVAAGAGAAYLFHFDSLASSWLLDQKIFADDGVSDDDFGIVSIDGDVVAVGAQHHSHNGIESGAVYIFRYDGAAWTQEAELLADDRAPDDRFGYVVAISGNVLLIGAHNDDDNGADSGSVYVFRDFGAGYVQAGKITAPDGAAGDSFGFALDYDGTTLAIGARNHDHGGPDLGAAYLFEDDGSPDWLVVDELVPPVSTDGLNNGFATCVDVDDDRLVIGAVSPTGPNVGSAHLYLNVGGTWQHTARMVASDGPTGNYFGFAVAVRDNNVAVGAHWDNDLSGAVYFHTDVFIPDCNANCIDDALEIAGGTALDCNGNGIPDACDLTDGVTLDCNNNGIPDECEDCNANGIADECELAGQYAIDSPQLSPIGLGSPVTHTFTSVPEAQGDVTLDLEAIADLAGAFQRIDVYLNNSFQGQVFADPNTQSCPATPDADALVIPMADYNALVTSAGGDATFRLEANSSLPTACGGSPWVSISLSYLAPPATPDVNGNGVPDECDLARGDNNLDGVVDVTDLLSLLAQWGACPAPCPEDTDGDGVVNVIDLLALLAGWG